MIVVYGGRNQSGPLDDTWEFDGVTWTPTSPPAFPAARIDSAMVGHAATQSIVLFGGREQLSGPYFDDTQAYRLHSSWPDEACGNGADDDGDALVDCADPDCSLAPGC